MHKDPSSTGVNRIGVVPNRGVVTASRFANR